MPPKKTNRAKPPRKPAADSSILRSILQAILDLRNSGGSTEKQITRQIEAIFIAAKKKPRAKQLSNSIRNALHFAVHQGVLVRRNNRYRLAAGVQSCRPIRRTANTKVSRKPIGKKRTNFSNVKKPATNVAKRLPVGRPKQTRSQRLKFKAKKAVTPKRKPKVKGSPKSEVTTFSVLKNRPHRRRTSAKKKNFKRKIRQATPGPDVNTPPPSEMEGNGYSQMSVNPSSKSVSGTSVAYKKNNRKKTAKSKSRKRFEGSAEEKRQEDEIEVSENNSEFEVCDHPNNIRCDNPNCLCHYDDVKQDQDYDEMDY